MKTLAVVLTALLIGGCSVLDGWRDPGEPRRVDEVARATVCGGEGAEAWVRAYATTARLRQAPEAAPLPGLEALPNGAYVLIGMGQRSSGGHGLAVSREAFELDGRLRLQATFVSPAAGRMTTQMLTSPCVLLRVPATEWREVEVIDQDGQVRARGGVQG